MHQSAPQAGRERDPVKLWPGDPEPPESDRFVTAVVLGLTVLGIVIAYFAWGR